MEEARGRRGIVKKGARRGQVDFGVQERRQAMSEDVRIGRPQSDEASGSSGGRLASHQHAGHVKENRQLRSQKDALRSGY